MPMAGADRWMLLVLLAVSACKTSAPNLPTPLGTPPAEGVLLTNARIWTGDVRRPWVEALGIAGAVIVAAGSDAEVRAAMANVLGAHTRQVNGNGRLVVPGFIDAHVHLLKGGLERGALDLSGAQNAEQMQARLASFAANQPERKWITGRGWNYGAFASGLPHRATIDAVVADRPVFVVSYDGHGAWVNGQALLAAGIGPDTPDPPGGRIVRDEQGAATGVLLESAIDLVENLIPPPSNEARQIAIVQTAKSFLRKGITTICEIGGDLDDLALYDELAQSGRLPIRVVFAPSIDVGMDRYDVQRRRLQAARTPQARVLPGPMKDFVDGVVEANTAALLEPPADGSGPASPPLLTSENLRAQIRQADALGIDLAYHAIGDGAVRAVLDAVQSVNTEAQRPHRRLRIEHIEVVAPQDLSRFKDLGVVASMMPLHAAPGDEPGGSLWSNKLGPQRLRHAFAFRSLLDAGAALAFGSDWPVMGLDPLEGVAIASTRSGRNGKPEGGWIPHQRIAAAEALSAYTRGAAHALRIEDIVGTLAAGMAADLVVLSPNVEINDGASFFAGDIDMVIVRGQVVR